MNDRAKLITLIENAKRAMKSENLSCNIARNGFVADFLIANGVTIQRWIPVDERLPQEFVSVLGYMIDAGSFPPVRECYVVGKAFFFPALRDVHPVSHWMPIPQPPKEVE